MFDAPSGRRRRRHRGARGANVGVVAAEPRASWHGLRDVNRGDGALLIFDEVITGFRVARGGAQARYGVEPDLTTPGQDHRRRPADGAYGGRAT